MRASITRARGSSVFSVCPKVYCPQPELFSMNRGGWSSAFVVFAVGAIFCGCRQSPPERKLIDDAARALGGKDKILAVKALTIQGQGADINLGQNVTPEGELPAWKVTEFQET